MGRFDHIRPEGHAEEAPPADPGPTFDASHFVAEAERAMAKGDHEGALKLYGRALQVERERLDAWLGQVRALVDMGHPEEAFTWLEQATSVLGERPQLHAMRAIASARCGNREDALAWSDRAMREGQDHVEVWLSRAEVLYLTQRPPLAAMALEKAAERSPGALTERRAGEVALQYDDLGRAAIWLERAARHAPEDPLVALRLGVLRDRQGDEARARAELERALALSPQLSAARLALRELDGRSFWEKTRQKMGRWLGGS